MSAFSVASFNARWGLGVDDAPYDVPAVIARLDTDVISLQEVWDPHDGSNPVPQAAADGGYRMIHTALSGSTIDPAPEITTEDARIEGTWGVALLTRLPVRRTRIVDLGRLAERWDVADRLAIIATLEVDGVAVDVAAIHLSFALPNALAQLRRLGGYLPVHRPTVVAGDCNLWGPLATAVVGGHRRSVRGRTWPAHRPHSQLDHILVSPGIDVVASRVRQPMGSDHRPVEAVLALPDGSA